MEFDPLREDFLRITTDIVYCTVTTVDPEGRPRSRVCTRSSKWWTAALGVGRSLTGRR
jgi:hypothetical protein